jgi:hypothetical protein
MSMKCCNLIPSALVVLGILLGVFLVNPASYAGDAVILQPAEDRDVPEGSQIPDWRIYETEEKVKEYKEKMKDNNSVQRQEGLPQNELPKPKGEQ